MKLCVLLSAISLFVAVSASAAEPSCKTVKKNLDAQAKAVMKYIGGGYDSLTTKSDNRLDMVKEFIENEYGEDSEYSYVNFTENIPGDESTAGITSRGSAKDAILGSYEEWYRDEEDEAKNEKNLASLKAATQKLIYQDGVAIGFDAGAQGWGGSPATQILVLHPRCKIVESLFLGIHEG